MDLKYIRSNNLHEKEFAEIAKISELAYKNWEIYWSTFIPSHITKILLQDFCKLSDLEYFLYGGYENAERNKIACYRKDLYPEKDYLISNFPAKGINLRGNFLFDNATQNDFRTFLVELGIQQNDIGDIWTLGERGAQGIVTNISNKFFNKNIFYLREVEVYLESIEIKDLKKPVKRIEKIINTVEASTRLDAIASAGYRISRSKIAERIKSGLLTLNGAKVKKSTITLKVGDHLILENKGFIEILEIVQTKRERWKIKLIKK